MGGRDRTLFAAARAPRDPWRAEVAGAWAGVQVPQERVDWHELGCFVSKSRHLCANMTRSQ